MLCMIRQMGRMGRFRGMAVMSIAQGSERLITTKEVEVEVWF